MDIRLSGVAAAAALAISTLVGASAQAAVFNFSYTFGDGQVAAGVVEGTVQPDGNTIDVFTVDSLTTNGQSIDPAIVMNGDNVVPAIATFDGSFMDFVAQDPTLRYGLVVQSVSVAVIDPLVGLGTFEGYKPAHWSITETGAAVPEPATWAMMLLGFAGLGYAAYQRRGGALA